MEQSMASSSAMSTPMEEVESLIGQVAAEHGLEVSEQLDGLSVPQQTAAPAAKEEDDLAARLEKLKNN